MCDERLKALERRLEQVSTPQQYGSWLLEMVRAGALDLERVRLAACVGHEAALLAMGSLDSPAQAPLMSLSKHLDPFPDPSLEVARESQDLERLVEAEKAVAAVHFDWSGPSFEFRRLVSALALTWDLWGPGETKLKFFSLEPDHSPWLQQWLHGESDSWGADLANGGSGSALWIRSGEVVDFLPCYEVPKGVGTLVERTRTIFGSGQQADRA